MRRVAAVCLLFILVGCGETPPKPASGPAEVVETLMQALEDGNCESVKRLVVRSSEIDCAQVSEAAGMLAAEGVDPDEVRYVGGKVVDDSTTVTITWSTDLPPEPIDVQRVDGEWLVVFDSVP